MRSIRTRRPGLRRGQRGLTIIEGLVSAVILLIGMLGIIRGIVVASQQNSMANQMTRAGAITSQVRVGMESVGRDRLLAGPTAVFLGGNCIAPNDPRAELAGGLESNDLANDAAANWVRLCIVDLDAVEDARAEVDRLVPGYSADDRTFYRRFAVLFQTLDTVTDTNGQQRTVEANQVGIVVSWMSAGQRVFSRRFVGFYNSNRVAGGNSTQIDI